MPAGVTFNRFDWVGELLSGLEQGCNSPNARALLEEIREIVYKDIRDLRMKGLRNDMTAQLEVKESTIRRRGPGVTLAPHGERSLPIRHLKVVKSPPRKDSMEVRVNYPPDVRRILDILAAGEAPLRGPRPTDGISRRARREIANLIAHRWVGRGPIGRG